MFKSNGHLVIIFRGDIVTDGFGKLAQVKTIYKDFRRIPQEVPGDRDEYFKALGFDEHQKSLKWYRCVSEWNDESKQDMVVPADRITFLKKTEEIWPKSTLHGVGTTE